MQVVENWADLVCTVREVRPEASPPSATVEVEEVLPVPGWPVLLGELAGTAVQVRVPPQAADAVVPGSRMILRARLAGPKVVYLSGTPSDHRPAA